MKYSQYTESFSILFFVDGMCGVFLVGVMLVEKDGGSVGLWGSKVCGRGIVDVLICRVMQ